MPEREKWNHQGRVKVSPAELHINQADRETRNIHLTASHNTAGFRVIKVCFYGKSMKGDRKRRANFFKRGNKISPKKRFNHDASENIDASSVRYVRPTLELADLIDQDPIQPLAVKPETDSDKPEVEYKLLRSPKKKKTSASDASPGGSDSRPAAGGYRLFHTKKLWEMINTVVRKHREHRKQPCPGNLDFDYSKEEKWATCWSEYVVCDTCSYSSPKFKLYEEVNTDKRGRKASTANVGLSVGLTQTPAGPTSIVKLYASSNIPPPTRAGLQKRSNAVTQIIKDANIHDMQNRRKQLKEINKLRNRPEHEITIQSDGQFNNPLFSGVGKTPFQPATQCTYTVAENETHKKQIIALETVNKLCSKHGFHSMEDEPCDIKSGECSATASMETCIGDEEAWAKACLEDLKKDGLEVKYVVTDPDTSANRAAETLFRAGSTKTRPEHQIDTRHLSQNHRKFIKNSDRVLAMMPGHTQAYRMVQRNRFAIDLSARCIAEYNAIHTSEQGDFDKIASKISRCVIAIKHCYAGDHSRCQAISSICKGKINDNWILKSAYLLNNFKIDIANEENEKTLADCIDYRLGEDMLKKTRLNLNSQKS